MINRITDLVASFKTIPKFRLAVLVSLSALFTAVTIYLFPGFFKFLIFDSYTLSNFYYSLENFIGYKKFQKTLIVIKQFSKVFILLVFVFYLYILYRREMKKQYVKGLEKIIQETSYVAEGNFDHQIQVPNHNDLDSLAVNVNNIVLRLKKAIEEERHVEHTKNELITNVAHDLRTPLTSIVGYLRIIEQDQYRDEVSLRHYTGIAYEKALSLEHLINELFEYTRMQDNKLMINKAPINIAEILGQIVVQNDFRLKENQMIYREHIVVQHPIVFGDGERLARVFDNLITNAIHYGKDSKYLDITAEEQDDQIIVTVTNYGSPIPSVDLPHIFDRFYRSEKSRSTHTGGSGLGLAIAKSIVTYHNGTIEVTSDTEKTSFIVKLKKVDAISS